MSRLAGAGDYNQNPPIKQFASRPCLGDGSTTSQVDNEAWVVVLWRSILIGEVIKHTVGQTSHEDLDGLRRAGVGRYGRSHLEEPTPFKGSTECSVHKGPILKRVCLKEDEELRERVGFQELPCSFGVVCCLEVEIISVTQVLLWSVV